MSEENVFTSSDDEYTDIDGTDTEEFYMGNKRTKNIKKKRTIKCEECGFVFKSIRKFKKHKSIHHKGDFECDKCKGKMQSKSHLEEHIKKQHTNDRDFECDKCDVKTKSMSLLEEHIKNDHSHTSEDYESDKCNETFESKSSLEDHIKSHHNKNSKVLIQLKCVLCEFQMEMQTNFLLHMESHEGRPTFNRVERTYEQCRFKQDGRFWPNCSFSHHEVCTKY